MKKVISILAITGASLLTASIPSYAGDLVEFSVIPDGTISVKKYDPLTFMVVIQGFVSGHITGYSYFVNWDGTELVTSTGQQPSMLHQKTGLYIDPAISTEIGTFTFTVNNPTPFAAVDFSLPDFFIDTRNQAYLPKYQINDNKNPDGTIQWQNGNIKPQQVDVREAPEPLTNLGAVVVLGAIPVLKKKYAKSNKNKDGDT